MKSDKNSQAFETGEKVWESLSEQVAEGSGFINAMMSSVRKFIRKQFLYFLIYAVAGAAISAGLWSFQPKVYFAEMTVSYVHYEKKIYADMLAKLNDLVKSKSYVSLSQQLKLPLESVKMISSITGYNIRHEPLVNDLSTEKIPFYVEVSVQEIDILPELQASLVSYMNGTEFIQERLAYMQKKNDEELAFLTKRLASVDSLSNVLNTKSDGLSEEEAVTRMELLQETLSIYDRMQNVKGSLAFNKNIEVLDGFVSSEKPSGKPVTAWLLYGLLGGIVLRVIVLFIR